MYIISETRRAGGIQRQYRSCSNQDSYAATSVQGMDTIDIVIDIDYCCYIIAKYKVVMY